MYPLAMLANEELTLVGARWSAAGYIGIERCNTMDKLLIDKEL
jgi:hypothetical protein